MTVQTWTLPSELIINDIDDIKSLASQQYLESVDLVIDSTHLTRIDTIGVQFLLAFVQKRTNNNYKTRWQNLSEILLQSLEQLGIAKSRVAIDE
ncbi:STAS domain-containing protein [Thalassotalea sp. LPB0316]|uniref:STAS domain-containing protein n=1 Tax=Thalassotalea sp. LPB0316 TaxID=2769490 RepID=UPI001868FA7C|nr:STAS domain-containing protein [Thalassotalea sp. LPB0316]QOL24769.1 STAS domain-containing protein [Thalassotalea sp. LPB0316]